MHSLLYATSAWVFASIVILAWAGLAARCIAPRGRSALVLTTLFLDVHLTTLVLLGAGRFGWLRAGPLLMISGMSCVPLALILITLRRRVAGAAPADAPGFPKPGKLQLILAIVLVTAQCARMINQILVLPPYVEDVMSYHLPKVAEWVQAGRITLFNTPVLRTYWPSGFELYQTWFALFAHHDFMIEAAGLPFLMLGAGSVYSIARSTGAGRSGATWGALVFGFVPANVLNATACTNDLPVTALWLYAMAMLLHADGSKEGGVKGLVLAGSALLAAIGIKPTAGFLGPGVLIAAVAALPGCCRGASIRFNWVRACPFILLVLSALVLAGFWYADNWRHFGNPFYPTDVRVFGRLVFGSGSGGFQQGSFSLDSLWRNLQALWHDRLDDHGGPFDPDLPHITGWGWTVFVCGWPAAVASLLRSGRYRFIASCFLSSLFMLFAMISCDIWNMRFASWFPAIACVGIALYFSEGGTAALRRPYAFILATCLALDFTGVISGGNIQPVDWRRMRALPLMERSTAAYGSYRGDLYSRALGMIPPGEPIAYHVNSVGWIYPLYDADYSRRLTFVPAHAELDLGQVLRELEIRWLFVQDDSPHVAARMEQETARGGIRQVWGPLYERIDPTAAP